MDTKEAYASKGMTWLLRTCSPDDIPVIGALKYHPNVFVNSGHGARSIALSLGSSKLLSEVLQSGDLKKNT